MKICDFCSTAKILMDFIGESKNINQIDFMYELFKDFMESDEAKDFDFDNGLVCRWLNGTAKLSPKITAYYSALGNLEAMAIDIEENILPLFYDKDMAVTELYDLLMSDTTVSETKKQELADNYPYKDDADISNFISKLVFFGMERKFIKRDANTKKLIASGALSPQTKDYIYSLVPKPCKHFCGRDNELEKLHTMLEDENKIFIQGIAGIGKSEFVKMYAQKYKKEYTNILYFSYGGSLKQMITDCDFADDSLTDGKNILLKKHNRFLRSLKEDTLIIIDNFNITASDDELFDVIMKYRCKILFTTRSRFKDYTYFELKEMPLESLLTLSEYFYADTRSNTNVVENIINELHYHTLSVELAARLLTSGILEPCRLLTELQSTKSVLHTDDKINIVKDGTSSKATYYEHIHKLLSLIGLSDKAVKIMRCMTLIPYDGINPRMLAKWIGLNNLNTINELIEYGFIQENDYRKITLHPLIQEIAIDDTKPGISSCINLIEAVRILCLYHGLDLPYHTLLFKIAENTIDIANNDDTERYKGKWQAKTQKEYLCKRGDEERGFTAAEFKTAQADGWEKQYQYKVDKKKLYMTPTEAEQQGYERVSKNPKSTRYGRQNPICAEWNSEEQVLRWRKAWEGVTNKALEQNSIDARVDCRSFKECGIDEQPTIHEGVSAHIIEQRGGVSERCEMNRQIKADNALLLEIKKQIKKLSAIVVDKVKKTVLDFANTLENLRNRYIFNRYEITQNENISTELKQYNTTIDVTVQRYNGIVQQLDNKITELKKMKAEQKHLNPIHIFRHKELTEHIDKTEKEIKKLQNFKSAFLDKMSCKSEKDIPQYKALHIKNDDIIIEIAANNTELEKQCADDKAEFISIKKSIPSEDMVAVQAERYTIHDEYTKSNIQKLQEKYGRKYSYDIYKDVEADVNMELHEKPFSILMRLEKNKQRNTDHNHTKYRNHEQER